MDGPSAPGSGTFSPAAPPRISKLSKRCDQACIHCRKRKTKCDGKPICGNCRAYGLPCSYLEHQRERKGAKDRESQWIYRDYTGEYIEKLEQRVADHSEQLNKASQRISELEAQMAALQQQLPPGRQLFPPVSNEYAESRQLYSQYQPQLLEGCWPPTSGNSISLVATPHDPPPEDFYIELRNRNCHPFTSNVPTSSASVLMPPSQTHPPVTYYQASMELQAMTAPSLVESGQLQAEDIINTSDEDRTVSGDTEEYSDLDEIVKGMFSRNQNFPAVDKYGVGVGGGNSNLARGFDGPL